MIPALLFAWGLLLPGGVGAQGPFSWDSAPPGSLPALSSAELRVAGALRRSRADRSLDHAALSAEISAAGQSVLQPCLNTLELGWVAPCVPGEVPQVLSQPQREILLVALRALPRRGVLAELELRTETWPRPETRLLALSVLGAVGDSTHLTRLMDLALSPDEEQPSGASEEALRAALARVLGNDPRAFERLALLLRDSPRSLWATLVAAVGDADDPRGLPFLEHVLTFHPEQAVLCAAQVRRIGRSGDPGLDSDLADHMRGMLDAGRPDACRAALLALGELQDFGSIPNLIELLDSDDPGLSGNALWGLQRMTGLAFPALPGRWESWYADERAWFEREEERTLSALHSGSPAAAAAAIRALGERRLYRDDLAIELTLALERPIPQLRAPICLALERLGAESAVPALVSLLEDDDPLTREAAGRALGVITGRKLPAESPAWRSALAMDT